jgi:hypothetical protein
MSSRTSRSNAAVRTIDDADPRLVRMRRLAWLLDRSIPIGPYRIGLDPLIGLIPGAGDVVGAGLSMWILVDAARIGIPVPVLLRMVGNILLELLVGAFPVVGDVFDFAWRANVRNLRLVDRHFDPLRAERPPKRIVWGVVALAIGTILGVLVAVLFVLRALWLLVAEVS